MLNNELLFCGDTFFKKVVSIPKLNSRLIVNLEAPITDSCKAIKNKVNLKIPYNSFYKTFQNQKLYAVNLSNNHIFDFGIEGFEDTINTLNQLNIKYFGVTDTKENIPFIIDEEIAVLSYCCKTTNPIFRMNKYFIHEINLNQIKVDIDKYKKQFNYIILQFHWGEEEIFVPNPKDIRIARKCIEYGADLIIGNHSHVIQSSEKYKGKFIYYGIGNFIFDDLNEQSYFDGLRYRSKYIKTQFKSNRVSMGINLIKDYSVKTNFFIYKTKLNKLSKLVNYFNVFNVITTNRFYYYLLKLISIRLRMIKIFLNNPRIISFRRIRLFFGI